MTKEILFKHNKELDISGFISETTTDEYYPEYHVMVFYDEGNGIYTDLTTKCVLEAFSEFNQQYNELQALS